MGGRILLVEDNERARRTLATLLRSHGFHVFSAAHGAQALARLEREPPDLVLTDLRMPLMDGESLAARIRKRRGTGPRKLPIVALTGEPSTDIADPTIFDAYLQKPVSGRDLCRMLDQLIS